MRASQPFLVSTKISTLPALLCSCGVMMMQWWVVVLAGNHHPPWHQRSPILVYFVLQTFDGYRESDYVGVGVGVGTAAVEAGNP